MNPAEALAREVVAALSVRGRQAYFVGGCVRDRLLGIESKDYDVATDATPDEVEALFPRSEAVGKSFGVILVKGPGAVVEVATFRSDFDYRDGRRPEAVKFTSDPEQDARRRDFTINGLFWDPIEDRLLDTVGGQADLERKIIRAIGEPAARFAEDKLRMLRAVRFAARLGFTIEPNTLRAIQAHSSEIRVVAAERIRDELDRILTDGSARRGFELLDESGLLQRILPEVRRLKGVEQSPEHHPEGDVWRHTLIMLEGLPSDASVTLAMGVLLHDIGKPGTQVHAPDRIRFHGHVERGLVIAEEICTRLRYSNAETEQILALVGNHMRFMHVREMRRSKLKRFLRMDRFEEHLELHRLDCASSHGKLGNWRFAKETLETLSADEIRPKPLLTGDDLIAAGYAPSPAFKRLLTLAEDAQLEGRITTKSEALALARSEIERGELGRSESEE